jgi:hypothetical protein
MAVPVESERNRRWERNSSAARFVASRECVLLDPHAAGNVSWNDECRPVAFTSQFQPPSGHCHRRSESLRSRTRSSPANPSWQQTAKALPSSEAHRRARPSTTGTPGIGSGRGQPAEHLFGGSEGTRVACWDPQLHEGDEAPVGTGPLAVGVGPEADLGSRQRAPSRSWPGGIGVLARQKGGDL